MCSTSLFHESVPDQIPQIGIEAGLKGTKQKPACFPATDTRIAQVPTHFHPSLVLRTKPNMGIP
jgi:hypothetical protein